MAKLPSSSSSFALDFLRRLLCARTTGGNADTAAAQSQSPPELEGTSPCIVARLMGLDAMPAEGGQSPCGLGDAAPAPVRESASLRERPAYLRAENDMFLLLSFSPEEERGATSKAVDGEDGPGKQRRGRRRKLHFGGDDEAGSESACRRECNAQQSSSPVSVLEVHEESSTTTTTSSSLEDVEPCSATSEGPHFALEQQSSTRKLHISFAQLEDMSAATSTVRASGCSDRDRRNRRMVCRSEVSSPDLTGIWQPVCRLVEEDLKNMEWLIRDGANVVGEMDSEILDQLICEATVELVQLSFDASPFSYAPKMFSHEEQLELPMSKTRLRLEAPEHESRNCQWKNHPLVVSYIPK